MTLDRYTHLIRSLPYLDQAFETKAVTWKHYNGNPIFSNFYKRSFQNDRIKLSRADLFKACRQDFHGAIFSIIFWGYPRNMRGNSFQTILKSLDKIEAALKIEEDLSGNDFDKMVYALKTTGVGLSTLSKFLYFFQFKIEKHPCLIFDSRIIEVINDENGFTELEILTKTGKITEFNKSNKYVAYLQLMEDLSRVNEYEPDKLELFLFSMGKNLKSSN